MKRITIEEVKSRLPKNIALVEETYKNTYTKAMFFDVDYGEFWAQPKDVWNGHGHRLRGSKKISVYKTSSLEKVKSRLPQFVKIQDETYVNLTTEAEFIDEVYGKFIATPKSVINGKPHRNRGLGKNKRLTMEDIKTRLPKHISLREETYKNVMTKCVFVDKDYGEFITNLNSVFDGHEHPSRAKDNRKKTCFLKYGVTHPSQNRDILSKIKKSCRKTSSAIHWKTGEEVLCCGGYEKWVVSYLNDNKIDYEWQIPFQLSMGTYFCDLHLSEQDLYVEIKGWWRQSISKDKWEEFHNKFPNSELWDIVKLKTLGWRK